MRSYSFPKSRSFATVLPSLQIFQIDGARNNSSSTAKTAGIEGNGTVDELYIPVTVHNSTDDIQRVTASSKVS